MAKRKLVKTVKGFSWEDMGRTASGLVVVAGGSAIGMEIGSLIAGYVAQRFICKGTVSKQFVMAISILNAVDILLERFMPRGVV